MVARNYESPADSDTDNTYALTITVTDADNNSDSEAWVVTVADVTETVSFTINAIADVTINENAAYTSVTPALSGTPIGSVTYTISGGTDAGDFSINSSTGVVTMVARNYESPADSDTDNTYALTITVTDADNNSDSEAWVVTVADVTETVSFTINAIADVTINENAAYTSVTPALSGTPIGSVTYTISGGTDAGDFSINSSTGVVTMVARNYESPADSDTDNTYALTITVTDADNNSDSEAWVVTVADVTETVSFTINAIADVTINENAAYTSVTPALSGTPIGSVTYTISGTDAGDFSINSSTGVVTMVARNYESPADSDTDNTYALTITVTDADNNSDSEAWVVTVADVTETVSFTINAIADVTINENAAYTSVTPALSGTPIGSVTYTISGGTDAGDFSINSSTGVVTMVARNYESPADSDTDNTYALTITVTDADNNSDSEAWVVTVADVTETVSFTINAIADVTVNENAAYTSVTPALSGTPIGSVTYTISGGTDAGDFSINSSTGVVSMVARNYESPADSDTDNTYALTITVTDADNNSDSEAWVVTVADVTETVSFTINAIADVTINENAAYTSVTPALSGTPIGSVTYTISGGTDAGDFSINSSTGVVTMVARNYESPADSDTDNTYALTITVTDADNNSDSEAWVVTVADVTETVSFTINAIADVTINENAAYTSVTPALSGTPIGSVTYTISGGTDAGDFSINSSTGVVTMVARNYESPADSDTDNTYALTITVTDADNNSDSEAWVVTVADVTETVSFTINAIADVTINENAAYTSVTPALSGTPIGSVTYTISGGTDAGDFSINSSTGVVTMVARNYESPADSDTNNTYALTITVTDADNNSDSEAWVVTVADVTETVSFTINAIADVTINENAAYTSVTPALSGTPIGSVTYTISGGTDAGDFSINSSTGVVTMVARNYESPADSDTNNTYALTITVTDADNNTDSEAWVVTVADVTETVSFTINAIADVTINENAAYTSVTPALSGTPIGSVTYTISGGTDAGDFSINSSTGVVTMVARNYESPADSDTNNTYALTITVTDADNNSDSEAWVVTVADVTETVSFTINAIADVTINENAAYTSVTPALSGTPIGSVTYTISGGTDAGDFSINSSTGVVTMVARNYESPADSDTNNTYALTITVTDADNNSDSEAWVVTVADVTESALVSPLTLLPMSPLMRMLRTPASLRRSVALLLAL